MKSLYTYFPKLDFVFFFEKLNKYIKQSFGKYTGSLLYCRGVSLSVNLIFSAITSVLYDITACRM